MTQWDPNAVTNLIQVQSATSASNDDMKDLRNRIFAWANANPPSADGFKSFDFGRIPDHHVTAYKANGWIRAVKYGDA